jgi:serine phosphatase RsbU (regulator of sigma subunit)
MNYTKLLVAVLFMLAEQSNFAMAEKDSLELRNLHKQCWEVIYSDLDSAMHYANLGLKKLEENPSFYFEACFHNVIASVYSIQGDLVKSIEGYQLSYDIAEKGKDIKGQAFYANNLGNVFYSLLDTVKALKYYSKSLELHGLAQNDYGLGLAYSNLSVLHEAMLKYDKAFEYQLKAIPYKIIHDSSGLGESYYNLAMLYMDLYLLSDDSLQLFSQKIWQINQNEDWRNSLLDSIDIYFEKSIFLHELNQHDFGKGITLKGMADLAFFRKDYKKALFLFQESMNIAERMDATEEMRDVSQGLYKVYKVLGDVKNALYWHERYLNYYKSIASDETLKEVTRKELSFQYDKKALEDSLAYAQQKERDQLVLAEQESRLEKERIVNIAALGGLFFFLLLSVLVYRGYRAKKRDHAIISAQKIETEEKKLIIEEKQREILDSINYAQRLQRAILATPDEIGLHFKESFLLYLPKDIVAGDFYFFEATEEYVFCAAADCTGHGVPGALVSIVCSNALSRCVKEFQLKMPGEILDKTTELVVETFEKSGQDVKDGMDISLLVIHKKKKEIWWAGANNPLWYVVNNSMVEITADKQPVGKSDRRKKFTSHQLDDSAEQIQTLYLFTDGFADQFGGPKGKKYKYANFKEFLLSLQGTKLSDQQIAIHQEFKRWIQFSGKPDQEFEQLDDICVIGLKPF